MKYDDENVIVLAIETCMSDLNVERVVSVAAVGAQEGLILATTVNPEYELPATSDNQLSWSAHCLELSPTIGQISRQLRGYCHNRPIVVWDPESIKRFLPFLNEVNEAAEPIFRVQSLSARVAPFVSPWCFEIGNYRKPAPEDVLEYLPLVYRSSTQGKCFSSAQFQMAVWIWLAKNQLFTPISNEIPLLSHPQRSGGEALIT